VERMTRTNQCTFLDSCLYKSGLMTLADVQSDCTEQRAVPHPHYLTCTNFHHCRHYLTHPLFFVFAVRSRLQSDDSSESSSILRSPAHLRTPAGIMLALLEKRWTKLKRKWT